MVVEIVCLLILRPGNVGSHDTAGLKSNIDHHLEHVRDIILDAAALEERSLLIVIHLHITSAHLDHSVVDGLIGMLKCLKIGVFQSEKRS